jgi:mono/diheme cytochrome c family protein
MGTYSIFSRLAATLAVAALTGAAGLADDTAALAGRYDLARGKLVYEKLGLCLQCHGWDGAGRGKNPRSPGPGANLRESGLDFETLRYVIACGRPGTAMPYHDRMAYRDDRCGMLLTDFPKGETPQSGKSLTAADIDHLVAYIMTTIQGAGKTTLAQCEAFYKPGAANCRGLK